jgi:hypothetical protein
MRSHCIYKNAFTRFFCLKKFFFPRIDYNYATFLKISYISCSKSSIIRTCYRSNLSITLRNRTIKVSSVSSDLQVGQIKPLTNTLLFFRGNLQHSVNQVKSSQARISLVCEQYNLSKTRLKQIPEFEIQSQAIEYPTHNT